NQRKTIMEWYTGKVREPLLEGETAIVGGQAFIIAPLNIKRMRMTAAARATLREVSEAGIASDDARAIAAITQIAAAALSANYPDISEQSLDENEYLNTGDLGAVLEAM